MKNKDIIKKILRFLIKAKYTIKGFFSYLKLEEKKVYYSKELPGKLYTYLGKRKFGYVIHQMVEIFEVYDKRQTNKYKFWELGMLDFKKYGYIDSQVDKI